MPIKTVGKTVGIIGYGFFGALAHTLINRFAPNVVVRVYSHNKKPDGAIFFPISQIATCDAVLLAVPIRALEDVLKRLVPLARKDTVIVDVSTVKVYPVALLGRLAQGRRFIATHPVWGPESYAKRGGDVSGFRIVVCAHSLPKADYDQLRAFLGSCGFDVVEVEAQAHDRHLAETLFLTHFIGQTILHGGFGRTEIDTVSFGFLMDAVESIKNDGALFEDVFRFNPYCEEVLNRFKRAEREVSKLFERRAPRDNKDLVTIGISGAKGSFSEEAAREYVRRHTIKKFSLEYRISVENVLSALERGSVDLGIFPIENSTGGVVREAIEGMAKYNFRIKQVFEIQIRQNLLVRKGAVRDTIKTITSHEQALLQCGAYLKRQWKNATVKEYEDTAKAAEDLARGKLPASYAVIASSAAAKIYKLKVLDEFIQDQQSNLTSFIAAERR